MTSRFRCSERVPADTSAVVTSIPRCSTRRANRSLRRSRARLVADGFVARCGDDIGVVLLHAEAAGSPSIASLVRRCLRSARTPSASGSASTASTGIRPRRRCRADASPSRDSEPVLCFFSDKAAAGSWNVHLYRAFADPFNTPTLVADPCSARVSRSRRTVDELFDVRRPTSTGCSHAAGSDGARVTRVVSRATGRGRRGGIGGSDPV